MDAEGAPGGRGGKGNGQAATPSPVRHVIFTLAGEQFGLPLDSIREVVNPEPPFARVPRAPDAIRGAMNLRGRVITLLDLAALLGLPPHALDGSPSQIIVLDQDQRCLGLLVGSVLGVESFEPPPKPEVARVVRGVASLRGAVLTVLEADGVASQLAQLFAR